MRTNCSRVGCRSSDQSNATNFRLKFCQAEEFSLFVAGVNLTIMQAPSERWGELFVAVQSQHVFPDGKTFVDCEPKMAAEVILAAYAQAKEKSDFDLKAFVLKWFDLPPSFSSGFEADARRSMSAHISALWPVLTRQPDQATDGSLLPLPYPYIVPGGRFGEIYYWDSYFTMLGLVVDGEWEMIENMVRNFAHLIDTVGFIPNGNRTYFLTRSQPPFFACMVELLAEHRGEELLLEFYPQLQREYAFWMNGTEQVRATNEPYQHVVQLADGQLLNRYYDYGDYPREESYREDLETAAEDERPDAVIYRELRAGCESGWDFTARWLADGKTLATIHTTDIIPVDLNALLYQLEQTLAAAAQLAGDQTQSQVYTQAARARKAALQAYCWDNEEHFYRDYDFRQQAFTPVKSMAGVYPLFFKMADFQQAERVARVLKRDFLGEGGFRSTLVATGQQWDAPNGWAPLQWMAYRGLLNYNHHELAHEARRRWLANCQRTYDQHTKMVEKYRTDDLDSAAGGGEYPLQDGFGWSNGVAQRFLAEDK
ncbi:MAG: alpha,alpha-trehalase TreF [Bacteroidota bacterium]